MTQISKNDLKRFKQILSAARNKYDNALINIEKVWGRLKSKEYSSRKSLVMVMTEMAKIDKKLKIWETKLKT